MYSTLKHEDLPPFTQHVVITAVIHLVYMEASSIVGLTEASRLITLPKKILQNLHSYLLYTDSIDFQHLSEIFNVHVKLG